MYAGQQNLHKICASIPFRNQESQLSTGAECLLSSFIVHDHLVAAILIQKCSSFICLSFLSHTQQLFADNEMEITQSALVLALHISRTMKATHLTHLRNQSLSCVLRKVAKSRSRCRLLGARSRSSTPSVTFKVSWSFRYSCKHFMSC